MRRRPALLAAAAGLALGLSACAATAPEATAAAPPAAAEGHWERYRDDGGDGAQPGCQAEPAVTVPKCKRVLPEAPPAP